MQNWSKTYFKNIGLTKLQHKENNKWFVQSLKILSENGVLIVPTLGRKCFNKQGQEVDKFGNSIQKYDYIFSDLIS